MSRCANCYDNLDQTFPFVKVTLPASNETLDFCTFGCLAAWATGMVCQPFDTPVSQDVGAGESAITPVPTTITDNQRRATEEFRAERYIQ